MIVDGLELQIFVGLSRDFAISGGNNG